MHLLTDFLFKKSNMTIYKLWCIIYYHNVKKDKLNNLVRKLRCLSKKNSRLLIKQIKKLVSQEGL